MAFRETSEQTASRPRGSLTTRFQTAQMTHRLAEAYKRWRHTRGYGVHSPFAYTVVKEVIRPGRRYAYYGYEDIDCALGRGEGMRARRTARTLLRLAAFLDTDRVFMPNSHDTTLYLTALRAAGSRIHVTSAMQEAETCGLVCSTGDYMPLERLVSLLRQPGRTLALHDAPAGWAATIFDSIGEGLMFYGRKNVLIFSRPDMQKVSYSILI